VQRRDHAVGDDACAERAGCGFGDAAIQDELDLFRPAQLEILTNHLLKEHASTDGTVQHLGEGQLDLPDRELITITGSPVGGGVRMGETAESFTQQRVDLGRRQRIADLL